MLAQRINHFPGSHEICRKDSLAKNLSRMEKQFPTQFNFMPQTWVLPQDHGAFSTYCRTVGRSETFIFKPENGCQGRGIALFKGSKPIRKEHHGVVQRYLAEPYLIDGYKVDFRIYVLVTACEPTFRVYIYEDGLARLATIKYKPPTSKNLSDVFCHLTNYSINKNSDEFDDTVGAGEGSKRKLSWVRVRARSSPFSVQLLIRASPRLPIVTTDLQSSFSRTPSDI